MLKYTFQNQKAFFKTAIVISIYSVYENGSHYRAYSMICMYLSVPFPLCSRLSVQNKHVYYALLHFKVIPK